MLWRLIVDTLFPSRCVSCKKEHEVLCQNCHAKLKLGLRPIDSSTYAIGAYDDPILRDAIHALKFDGRREAADILAEMLYTHGIVLLCATYGPLTIVPIPSTPDEHRERGFDPIALITTHMHKHSNRVALPISFACTLLKKRRVTKRQVKTRGRAARLANIRGAFATNIDIDYSGRTILVIDDVTTTGATFAEARRAFNEAKPGQIIALAIAH